MNADSINDYSIIWDHETAQWPLYAFNFYYSMKQQWA